MNPYVDPVKKVLGFWFGSEHSKEYGKDRAFWFESNPDIDLEIEQKFYLLYRQAKEGCLNALEGSARGMLALIILLDQMSRHLFRGTKNAFATDAQALALAKRGILKGADQFLPDFMKLFFYLPLEHSENLADQQGSVRLFRELGNELYLKYALEHQETIKRFGRFPERNLILNRASTEDERLFLNEKKVLKSTLF